MYVFVQVVIASPAGHASPITKLYHHVDQKMSWTDAQRYCREKFHDLATVDNREELERLKESRKLPNYDEDHTWIGLQDDLTRWQWADNQDYKMGQDYGNWEKSEPNNKDGGQNCTMISISTRMWKDARCHSALNAVCINGSLGLYFLNTAGCCCSGFPPNPFPFN